MQIIREATLSIASLVRTFNTTPEEKAINKELIELCEMTCLVSRIALATGIVFGITALATTSIPLLVSSAALAYLGYNGSHFASNMKSFLQNPEQVCSTMGLIISGASLQNLAIDKDRLVSLLSKNTMYFEWATRWCVDEIVEFIESNQA